jgi:hypothetical protein
MEAAMTAFVVAVGAGAVVFAVAWLVFAEILAAVRLMDGDDHP